MDGVLDVNAAVLEELRELADGMLGLRDGEAVTRHDDHVLGVGELDRDVVGADRADRAARAGSRARRIVASPEAADHDVHHRAVHRIGHELGQDRTRGADQGTGDDQDGIVDHEAGHRDGGPGE